MTQQIPVMNRKTFGQLAQVAAYVARPLEFVHDDHVDLPPLQAQAIRSLAGKTFFRGPINRAASHSLGLSKLSYSADFPARLESEDDLKITFKLLQSEQGVILDLARACAAVQLYPQIRACVLKAQRKHIEAVVGAVAFMTAIRETHMFYPSLPDRSRAVKLDSMRERNSGAIDDGAGKPTGSDGSIHQIVSQGLATLIAFAGRTDHGCGSFLALRFPKLVPSDQPATELTDSQAAEIKILLNRRGLTW